MSTEVEQLASREDSHNAVEKFIHSEAILGHISDDALFFRKVYAFHSDGGGVSLAAKWKGCERGENGGMPRTGRTAKCLDIGTDFKQNSFLDISCLSEKQ